MKTHETQTIKEEPVNMNDVQSFNNATDYRRNIIGVPTKKADLNSMPKPIRWFGYFFIGFVICALLSMVLIQIFH